MTERDPRTGHFLKTGTLARREAGRALARDMVRDEKGRFATRVIEVEYDWRSPERDRRLADREDRRVGVHYQQSVTRRIRTGFRERERVRALLDRRFPSHRHYRVVLGGDGDGEDE